MSAEKTDKPSEDRVKRRVFEVKYESAGQKFADTDPDVGKGKNGPFETMEDAEAELEKVLAWFNRRTFNQIAERDGFQYVIGSEERTKAVAKAWIEEYEEEWNENGKRVSRKLIKQTKAVQHAPVARKKGKGGRSTEMPIDPSQMAELEVA
jgi:hypothetical protein